MLKPENWTIDRWRAPSRPTRLEFGEPASFDQAPPLWKDLTLASAVAALLWVAAAVAFH